VRVGPPTPVAANSGPDVGLSSAPRPHRLESPTPKSLTCPFSVRLSHPSRTPTPCTAPGGPRYIGRRVVVGVPEEPGAVRSRGPTPSPALDESAQADGLVSVPGSAPCTPVRLTVSTQAQRPASRIGRGRLAAATGSRHTGTVGASRVRAAPPAEGAATQRVSRSATSLRQIVAAWRSGPAASSPVLISAFGES
jgi:hypothetical protein